MIIKDNSIITYKNYKDIVDKKENTVPAEKDWSKYKQDIDGKYLYKLLHNKAFYDVYQYFETDVSMSRGHELLNAPRKIFQYYIHSFILFLLSNEATGEPDPPSVFLNLLINRENQDPGSVAEIFDTIYIAINYIVNRQSHYDADVDIYGDFKKKFMEIKNLVDIYNALNFPDSKTPD